MNAAAFQLGHDLLHLHHLAEQVHGHEGFRARRDLFQHLGGIEVVAFGSMSAKTGVAPRRVIALTVAKNVNGVVITSSPGPTSSAIRSSSSASEPEAQPTACLTSR